MNKKTMIAALFCLLLVFWCGTAWAEYPEEEPIDGGTTNRTDYSAPKEIESDTIVGFDAHFFLFTRWKTDDTDIEFHFLIKEDDRGVLMASEELLGISCPADEELLASLQEVIRENDLASMNGVYEVTAGLAPEYSECGLTVTYDSGESLRFTINNNPYALWSEEVYDVFAEWFAANGDDALYPPQEDSQVTRFRLDFTEKGIRVECYDTHVDESEAIDGETYLLCIRVSDAETYDDLVEEYLLFPDDYYEPITEIISRYDLNRHYDFSRYDHDNGSYDMHDLGYYGMGGLSPADGEEDSEDMYLSIHLEYESGHRVNMDTGKESEIKGLKPLLTELLLYHDNLLWDTSEKTILEYLPEEFWETESSGEQFSLIINDPDDPDYSYLRCDYYLGDTQFGYFLGCPDAGDTFTHFDLTPDCFEGIEGDFDISSFHAEIYLGYNEYSGEDAVLQAMMGNAGQTEFLASLQFAPEYGERYEYQIVREGESWELLTWGY